MEMTNYRPTDGVRHIRAPWWGISTGNILDRATALFPRLHHARLDELGHDSLYDYAPIWRRRPASVKPQTKVGGTRRCRSIGITGSSSP